MNEFEEINGELFLSPHEHEWVSIDSTMFSQWGTTFDECYVCKSFRLTYADSTGRLEKTIVTDQDEDYAELRKRAWIKRND